MKEGGIDVKIVGTDLTAFIKRSELARDRSEQRPDRFAVGQKVDARVTQFDRRTHKVSVSIKALEVAEEKEAIAQYGSSDSGATLGDILGTALKRKGEEDDEGREGVKRRERSRRHRLAGSASPVGSARDYAATDSRAHSAAGLASEGEVTRSSPMSLDADLIVDRRRMRRKLTFWRVLADRA